ncbi:GNAT family N-acetyltransferase [Pseudomonas sp. SCB32]|uniref:GNAT family N-acetyltransferase n=1 Tax=Pseudomonas sp. SCB32 TaxID=2653853 RepID=UPI00126566D2|nr:N-acetyltransferase [Pseudomonas sp. SCB32]
MATLELNLRPMEDADLAFLRELYASTRAAEMERIPWDKATKDAFLTQQFNAQHQYYQAHYEGADFSLICHDDQPIGRLYVFRGPTTHNLIDISLMPQWHRRGIGTGFIADLTREADALGRSIRLFVEPENPALRLYERFGFRETGRRQHYLQMNREAVAALAQESQP